MRNIPVKENGETVDKTEYNPITGELKNAVESTSQDLDGDDDYQLAKAISDYSAVGAYYSDSGVANNYILSAIDFREGITAYKAGQVIRFNPVNTNTGASTVNVHSLGSIPILDEQDNPLTGSEMVGGWEYKIRYNSSLVSFNLLNDVVFNPHGIYASMSHNVDRLFMSVNVGAPTTTWDFTSGKCADSERKFIIINPSTFTKNVALPWEPGSGNGGRATSVPFAATGLYHSFALSKVDGTFDIGFDSNPTGAAIGPEAALDGYVKFRRINSFFAKVASAQIRPLVQYGNNFIYTGPDGDFDYKFNPITLLTQIVSLKTPGSLGGMTLIEYGLATNGSAPFVINLFNPDLQDLAPTGDLVNPPEAPIGIAGATVDKDTRGRTWINTNATSQISLKAGNVSNPNGLVAIQTLGYFDPRID